MFAGTGPYGCVFPCCSILPVHYMIIKKERRLQTLCLQASFFYGAEPAPVIPLRVQILVANREQPPPRLVSFAPLLKPFMLKTVVLCSVIFGTPWHDVSGITVQSRCATAVGSAFDGRRTHCLTVAVHVADGRRTMTFLSQCRLFAIAPASPSCRYARGIGVATGFGSGAVPGVMYCHSVVLFKKV